jgi:hypothetical protein
MKVAGSTRSAGILRHKHKHLHTHALQGENLGQPSEVAKSEKENVNKQAIKFFLLPLDDDDLHKQTFDASTHAHIQQLLSCLHEISINSHVPIDTG